MEIVAAVVMMMMVIIMVVVDDDGRCRYHPKPELGRPRHAG